MNEIVFNPDKVEEYERLTSEAEKIMEMLSNQIFIIEKFNTKERYDKLIWTVIRNLSFGFEHKEFRDCPAQYKFKDDPKKEVKWLPFRHFLINLMM